MFCFLSFVKIQDQSCICMNNLDNDFPFIRIIYKIYLTFSPSLSFICLKNRAQGQIHRKVYILWFVSWYSVLNMNLQDHLSIMWGMLHGQHQVLIQQSWFLVPCWLLFWSNLKEIIQLLWTSVLSYVNWVCNSKFNNNYWTRSVLHFWLNSNFVMPYMWQHKYNDFSDYFGFLCSIDY